MTEQYVYRMLRQPNKLVKQKNESCGTSRVKAIMGVPQTPESVGPGQYNIRSYDRPDYYSRRRIVGVDMKRQDRHRYMDQLLKDQIDYANVSAQTYTPDRRALSGRRIARRIYTADRDTTLVRTDLTKLSPDMYFKDGLERQDTRIPARLYRQDRFHRSKYQLAMDDLGPGSHDPKLDFVSRRR